MAMQLEHEFTIPVPVEQAWPVLLDVERVAPCLPGAALDSVDGDEFTGRMKVKVGPITVTYRGSARFAEMDESEHAVVMKGSGKEARGTGTASATVRAQLHEEGSQTRVTVRTTFTVTGRPAQFGRGVMAEVGARLIDRFAANLAKLLRESGGEASSEPADSDEGATNSPAARHLSAVPPPRTATPAENGGRFTHPAGTARTAEDEALDLLEVAGVPILKRVAPVVAAVAGLIALGWWLRRRLRR